MCITTSSQSMNKNIWIAKIRNSIFIYIYFRFTKISWNIDIQYSFFRFLQNSGVGGASDLTSLVKAVVAGSVAGTSAGSSGNKDSYGAAHAAYGTDNSYNGYVSFSQRFVFTRYFARRLARILPRKFKSKPFFFLFLITYHTTPHSASQLFSLMHRRRTPRSALPSMTSLTRY